MFLKNSQISQENNCVEVFFDKVTGPQGCNFIKKRLQHRCFPVKFAKYLRTPFFYRTPPVAASVFDYINVPCESSPTHIKLKQRLAYAGHGMRRHIYKKSRNVKLNRTNLFFGVSHISIFVRIGS